MDKEKVMKIQEEKGVAMVEATIYMPLVLCTVMALIYLALFNLQEYMMIYQTQRVAETAAREEAYLGYEVFHMGAGSNNEIDFSWGGGTPPSDTVTNYYKTYHENLSLLYREVGNIFSAIGGGNDSGGAYGSRFADKVVSSTLVALGSISTPEVKLNQNFFGTAVTVEITHSMPMPGVMAYLGYEGSTTLRAASYTYSVNPGEFVRNVDLGADLLEFTLDKLGIDYSSFVSKTQEVLAKVL